VQYVLENDMKEDSLFCKPIESRAMSLEVFNVINHFLWEKETNWDNCTDVAQSMSGQNA
jgi:hypothetical protein